MGRTRLAKATLSELNQRLSIFENKEQQLKTYLQKLKTRYHIGDISYSQYLETIHLKRKGKTIQEWIEYYEQYAQHCKREIKKQKRIIVKQKIQIFFFAFIFILFLGSVLYVNPQFIGFVVQEQTQEFSQDLNLNFNQSATYELQLENTGRLNSVKLSGLIKGEGDVRIYLDDLLILDNSKSKTKKITGSAIEELGTKETSILKVLVGFVKNTFLKITGKSVEESAEETNQEPEESYSEKPEEGVSLKEESSPSQDETPSSSETQTQPIDETEESYSEKPEEGVSLKEESSPSLGQDENLELPSDELGNDETPSSSENQTQPIEETEEKEKPEEKTKEEKPKKEITIEEFIGTCEQTCDLSELNLNKSSYELRIEVSNAELQINKIIYEIFTEEVVEEEPGEVTPEEIPENITEEPAPEGVPSDTPEGTSEGKEVPEINITQSPRLIKNIPDIEIQKNSLAEIKINEYFSYAEEYYLLQTQNLTTTTFDHTIKIQPDNDFTGTRTVKIIASNSFGIMESNFFNITVYELEAKPILIKNIPDIEIQKNSFAEIKINEYFSNAEQYYLLQIKNISTTTLDHTVKIQPDIDFTGTGKSKIIVSNSFGTAESNFFNIIVSDINITIPEINITLAETNITNITTIQYQAVINQPVKWKKNIELTEQGIVKIKLPKHSNNITVNKILDESIEEKSYSEEVEIPKEDSSPSQESPTSETIEPIKNITEEETFVINETIKEETINETISEEPQEETEKQLPQTNESSKKQKAKFSLTGTVILEEKQEKTILKIILDFFKNIFSRITGRAIDIEEQEQEIELTIDDNATKYEVEYETPAPYVVETQTKKGKKVKLAGPEKIIYENVLTFTELDEALNIKNPSRVKIKWVEQDEYIPVQKIEDKNNNGVYDYIEWISPSSDNQTYEIIIEITKAEHLDENREFISDIYDEVYQLDDVWSEVIPAEHYVRVTFETPLDNTRDITLYPRVVSGTPRIQVYEVNGTEVIAEFTTINSNEYNTIYLTGLEGCYDNETEILTRAEVDCGEEVPAHSGSQINNEVNEETQSNSDNDVTNNNLENDLDISRLSAENSAKGEFGVINPSPLAEANLQTEKCYKYLWKYFDELKDEKVATLNQETKELEWQTPTSYPEFDYDKDMFRIVLEDGSDLVVSERHKVYTGVENSYPNNLSLSTSCLVVNTSTIDCPLKSGSFDQTGILLNASDNARYSVSSLSKISEFACSRNISNFSFGTDLIFCFNFSQIKSISSEDSSDNLLIRDLCFSNSSNKYSGAYNSTASENMISLVTPVPINPVNKIVASRTNSIYCSSGYNFLYLLCNDLFTSFDNLMAYFSENLDLEIISLAIENSICFTNDSTTLAKANSNSFLNSTGMSTLTTISCIDKDKMRDYLKLSENQELVCLVMMSEEDEGNCFLGLINFELENKTFENVDTSFSSQIIPQGFVVVKIEDDLINFSIKNFSKQLISFGCFFNSSLTDRHKVRNITHFNDSMNFLEALYPIGVSFNAFFNSSICSGFIGNSSTGCQSICSQNSQSSSVTSLVCLNRSDMSRFINPTTALAKNLESNFKLSSGDWINSINNELSLDYKKLSISNFSLQPISEVYSGINNGKNIYFLNADNEPVQVKSITKEKYNGKIYDVDVGNDIVLVRRHSDIPDSENLADIGNDIVLVRREGEEKNKMGSNTQRGINGMEPNKLKPDCNNRNESKYLNVSVDVVNSRAGMAEWSTQSVETRYPSGCVGSIPTLGAAGNSEKLPAQLGSQINKELLNENLSVNNIQAENSAECEFGTINLELTGEAKYIEINGQLIDITGAVWSGNSNPQDTFDLKVVNGSVEIDHIIDPTQKFYEDWETGTIDAGDWANTAWAIATDQAQGTYSSKCSAGSACNIYTIVSIDTSIVDEVNVSFMYMDDDCDAADIILYFNDSAGNWDNMGNVDAGSLGKSDDVWNMHSVYSTDAQYRHAGFSVRFQTSTLSTSGGGENYWLDNINVTTWGGEDSEYPVFSNYWDDNGSIEGTGTGHFNVTLLSTNGTVWLEIDGNNITATNLTADMYNASHTFTSDGVYAYKWHSWGNGTSSRYNVSSEQSYTVLPPANITWNQSTLNLGSQAQTEGNLTGSAKLTSTQANANVDVNCDSGDCVTITDDWTDGTDMTNGQSFDVNFVCSNSSLGSFSAIFNVTSDDYTNGNLINVSCSVLSTQVEWNQSELEMGVGAQAQGNLTESANITSIGTNTNVDVNCDSGDCVTITDDWTDGTDMTNGQSIDVNFVCSNSSLGTFSAVFNISSDQDSTQDQINVSCTMSEIFMAWNQSTADIGTVRVYFSNTTNVTIEATGDNTNVGIVEMSGNGTSFMSAIPTSVASMNGGTTQEVEFTCSPTIQAQGGYETIYRVNSTEFPSGNDITVSCTVFANLSVQVGIDKSSYSWFGDVNVSAYVTNSSGDPALNKSVYATSSVDSNENVTLTDPDGDGNYTGIFRIGGDDGSSKPTGTFSIKVNASDVLSEGSAISSSFTTFIVRRWAGITTTDLTDNLDDYANFNTTGSGTSWHHDIEQIGIVDTVAHTGAVVRFPIFPKTNTISNLVVSGTGVNSYYIDTDDNIIVIDITTIIGTRRVDISFDAESDLAATYLDRVQTGDLGVRDSRNGYAIWNKFIFKKMFGSDHDGVGELVDLHVIEQTGTGTTHSVDCMERDAIQYDGACHAATTSTYYEWNIHWTGDSRDFLIDSKSDNTQLVFMTPSHGFTGTATAGSTAQWAGGQYYDVNKTVTFYADEKYHKYNYTIKNKDALSHITPLVVTREAWVYGDTTTRAANDRGIFPNDLTDYGPGNAYKTQSQLSDNWFAVYDLVPFYSMAMIYPSNDTINKANYSGFMENVAGTIPMSDAECNYPLVWATSGTDADFIIFEKNFSVLNAGETTSFEFYYWGGYNTSRANLVASIQESADEIEAGIGGNTAPQITHVFNDSMTDVSSQLNEGPSATSVIINFTASDAQGYANLDDSTAYINFTKADEETRINSTCSRISGSGTTANYTCNVTMWWWDAPGTWDISAYILDDEAEGATNASTTFQVGSFAGFYAGPSSMTWDSITPGAINQLSNNTPIVLNNSGNLVRSIDVNATDLIGETTPSLGLWAGNFSVDETDACDAGPAMVKATFKTITGASLPIGNYTDNTNGREEIYVCLETAGAELTAQAYSTTAQGSWTIRIFLVVFSIRRRKKGKIKNDKLLQALTLIADELKEEYSLNKKEITNIIIEKLKEKYKLNKKEVLEIIKIKETLTIPATIFSKKLGALEAIIKYMKENLGMSYRNIAQHLERDERTIWTAYKKSQEKQEQPLEIKETKILLPLSIFKNKKLTILEAVIIYLKQQGIKYSEMARIINRDQRNIWTVYSRAVKKLGC